MKKINFTIVLFAIGFIATATFAAFNYSIIDIGDSNSSSMANGINNSGEVFDIEDEKNNFGVPNAERVVSISNNDSGQIGGASDTSVMLAVAGADGEAADASDDIVSSEQSVTEDSEDSDQTAGNDDATQPFVWDNGLIAALWTPPGYSPVNIPFGINSIGRVGVYSGASRVTSSSGASGGTSSSAVSGGTSSAVKSETASSSNESGSTSSSGVSETASSPNLIENSVDSKQGTSDLLSPDSAGELILDSANGINGAEQAVGSFGVSGSTSSPELSDNSSSSSGSSGNAFSPKAASNDSINDIVDLNEFQPSDDSDWGLVLAGADEVDAGEVIGYNYDEVTLHPNPEPATIFLFGSGLISLGVFGRRKMKRF